MRAAAVAVALLAAPSAFAAVEVKADASGRLSVRADAPASEILDRLGAQTGMKVVYEGGSPRMRVSVAFEQRTPGEAVLKVLEGLGYDYLVRFDRSGTRPELLIVSGPSSNVARSAPAAASATARPVRPVEPEEDEGDPEEEPAEEQAEIPTVRIPDLRAQPQPAAPQAATRPAFGPSAPPNYPVSPFAPAAPGLPSVIAPPSPAPENQDAPPGTDPNQ